MITRKDIIIAFLATLCVTLALLSVVRTSSTPYDPWLDYNDDGRIDMRDIAAGCASFMAEGDPAKNVTVTNWPTYEPAFSKTLVLRATERWWGYARLLIDESTPYLVSDYESWSASRADWDVVNLYLNMTEQLVYSGTFIYQRPAIHDFLILGEIQTSITFNFTTVESTQFNFDFSAYLVAISSDGSERLLSYLGYNNVGMGVQNELQCAYSFISDEINPTTVFASERLAVKLLINAYVLSGTGSGHLDILFGMGTDQFVVGIPIMENP
jgi:hypothetical protein